MCVSAAIGMITPQQKEKKPHIKKPLNAFMLFMKEKRAEVIKDCTLKESAAINQILGKMVSHKKGHYLCVISTGEASSHSNTIQTFCSCCPAI